MYCDEKWNQENRKQIYQLLLFLTIGQNMLDKIEKIKASGNIKEVNRAVLNFLYFCTKRFCTHKKCKKAQKEHKTQKAQKAPKVP